MLSGQVFRRRSAPIEDLDYLATQHDESSNLSFPFLRLNSPQASSRGSPPIWDNGAAENGQEHKASSLDTPVYHLVTTSAIASTDSWPFQKGDHRVRG